MTTKQNKSPTAHNYAELRISGGTNLAQGADMKPEMREGDIYRWHYTKEFSETKSFGTFGYHCKSRIAIFEGGKLRDTFWGSSPTDSSWLNPSHVALTLLGNREDMEVLTDNEAYYDPDDLIVMRHSNDSGAKTLVKPGAKRSADVMRGLINQKRDDTVREIQSALHRLEMLAVAMDKLNRGELKNIYI